MVTLYVPVVFIQGCDGWDDFEKVAYPEREGSSLGFSAPEAATAYLVARMPDEMPDLSDGEMLSLGEYPSLHEGGIQHWHETEHFVAVWDAGYCVAGLWLKEQTTTRDSDTDHTGHPPVWPNYIDAPGDSDATDYSDDPDNHEIGCTCFLCIPGA